eukprot:evm.model.scf_1269.4 EVM.evm.TU.scf_1269.4   scf_1269:20000-25205(+)
MAALQNIGADNAGDSFYRYKMPILQAKIEGRGNGIKTNVVNNVDIAKALDRPPAYIIKFFGCELGALTSYDVKTGMSIVNGAHDSKKLAELLDSFIKKYVQCHSCGNPETRIKIKRENIYLLCKACGAASCVDMRHKVNNYILKNPPEEKLSKEEKKLKKQEKERLKGAQEMKLSKSAKGKDKEDKKGKKRDKKKNKGDEEKVDEKADDEESSAPQSDDSKKPEGVEVDEVADEVEEEEEDDGGEDDVQWHTDTSEAAMKKRAEEQLTQAAAALIVQGNVEAEKAEAKKAEKKALAKLGLKPEEVAAMFEIRVLIEEDGAMDAVAAKLKDVSAKAAVRMQLLFIALLGQTEKPLGVLVKERYALLKSVATTNKDQLAQLIGLEYFLGVVAPQHAKESSKVLNALYELKVVDEDLIIAWYDRPSAGATALGVPEEAGQLVRKHAQMFIDWLKEAEEEDDEDDDEDEEGDEDEEDDD